MPRRYATDASNRSCFFAFPGCGPVLDGWYNRTIDRYRSDYAFRGVHSAEYSLVSSFSRNCSDQWDLEHNILRNFSKYAEMEAPFMVQSVWKQMILGQHYGLPTRLLDWTYSPLIALHFATNDADLDCLANNNAAVWKVHVDDVHGQLPEEYRRKLSEETAHVFTVDMLNDITPNLKKYDSDMENSTFVFWSPLHRCPDRQPVRALLRDPQVPDPAGKLSVQA